MDATGTVLGTTSVAAGGSTAGGGDAGRGIKAEGSTNIAGACATFHILAGAGDDDQRKDPTTIGDRIDHDVLEYHPRKKRQLTLIPLIFLIFFEVSGGPYGEEPTVQAAGNLLAILGFQVFPFVWSIPEALITAELATAFPGNGGYVVWAAEAFGPFAGSMMGSWKYLSGVINNAAYPVLCADYLSRLSPRFAGGAKRDAAIAGFALALSFLNYTGLKVVGWATVALGAASLAPFVVMAAAAAPKVRPARWLQLQRSERRRRRSASSSRAEWGVYMNTLFWNLNTCDNASTLAGEVERPERAFPRALLAAGLLTCAGYLLPLLTATGALDVPQDQWTEMV